MQIDQPYSDLTAFQFAVLCRMDAGYRSAVLAQIGISQSQVDEIVARSGIEVHLVPSLGTYRDYLGPEVKSEPSAFVSELSEGSTAHYFVLPLWPHLFWVVNHRSDLRPWGYGFRNQIPPILKQVRPEFVRPGLWTRGLLDALAEDEPVFDDGWDDDMTYVFRIQGRRFAGRFVLDLLQEWRELP